MSAAEELAAQAAFKKARRMQQLKQIAAALGVPVERLFEAEEQERNAEEADNVEGNEG